MSTEPESTPGPRPGGEITFGRRSHGKTEVSVALHGATPLTDRVELASLKDRERFIGEIAKRWSALDPAEIRARLEEEAQRQAAEPARKSTQRTESAQDVEEELRTTDVGNAKKLAQLFGDRIRYVPGIGWHTWDDKRWLLAEHGQMQRLARGVARTICAEASNIEEQKLAEPLRSHARASCSRGRIEAMIALASSEPGLSIPASELDRDPFLLNVLNGTIDLRTGELRPHDRSELHSKLAPVEFDPAATCPRFDAFLAEILPDHDVREFVVRFLGYAMTGDVSEHVLPVFWGSGANGKSTLLGAVAAVLGDYAGTVPAELLLTTRGDRHPTERAMLQGMRLAIAHESDAGRRLAEGLVKALTGGDKIPARRMRQDFYEFFPTHKLVLVTNNKPRITGTDAGIWRRLLLIPFTVSIPLDRRDPELPAKLRAEAPGILTRLVAGAVEWHREGLRPPDAVRAATEDYRAAEDRLAPWLEECCDVRPDVSARSGDLFSSYVAFTEANREHPMSPRAFSDALSERGFTPSKGAHGTRIRLGLTLQRDARGGPGVPAYE